MPTSKLSTCSSWNGSAERGTAVDALAAGGRAVPPQFSTDGTVALVTVPLQVGERDFFLDLLFYHARLHCYVVVELKTVDFEPEFAGKLNFYLKAVDEQLRREGDQPTIGLLLCKSKNEVVAEYALGDKTQPMGVAEYKLLESLPKELQTNLPSIEQIERELGGQ